MDIKVNNTVPVTATQETQTQQVTDTNFKFILASNIEEADLQERLSQMMQEIGRQGELLGKHRDIKYMHRYRTLIKDFLNEIVNRSHAFSRENFLDRKGRHRVYGIIRLIDKNLDDLAQALVSDEKDNIDILGKIGEIKGLILDILT